MPAVVSSYRRRNQALVALGIGGAIALASASASASELPVVAVLKDTSVPIDEAVEAACAGRCIAVSKGTLGKPKKRPTPLAEDPDLQARVRGFERDASFDAVVAFRSRALPNRAIEVVLVDLRRGRTPVATEVPLAKRRDRAGDTERLRASLAGSFTSLALTTPAPAPAPAPAAPSTTEESTADVAPPPTSTAADDSADRALLDRRTSMVDSGVIVRPFFAVGNRRFDYGDRISTGLRSYKLAATPIVGAAAEVYPGALMTRPVLPGLGLTAEYSDAPALVSRRGTTEVNTSWSRFDVGMRIRIRIGRAAAVAGRAGYGGTTFDYRETIEGDASSSRAKYRFLRGGLEARIPFGSRFAGLVAADGLYLTNLGPLGARFSRAAGGGVVMSASVAFKIVNHVEVRTGALYERFFFSLNPEPGDRVVAGGALDEHARWETGVAFYL